MTTKQIIKSLRACGRGCCDDCVCIQECVSCKETYLEAADLIEQQAMKIKELKKYQKADKDGRLVVPSCNKVLTNADRMRTATNQQLAKQLYDNQKALCRMLCKKLGFKDELNFSEDYSDILAWLNAPSKEAEKALEAMKNE